MYTERKFRFKWLALGLALTPLVAADLVARSMLGVKIDPVFSGMALLAIWSGVGLLYTIFPTNLGPDGLKAPDGIGRIHEVPWDAVWSVGNALGFYIVRHGKFGTALCVPMFLEDRDGFRDYVIQHAPEHNPLRQRLEQG